MKLPVRLCFLHLFITLAWTETNKKTGLRKHHAIELQNQTGAVKLGKFTSRFDQGSLRRANTGGGKEALGISDDSKTWTSEHRKNHLFTINGGKRTPCQGKSFSRRSEFKVSKKTKLRNKFHRYRRTNSVFLVKALDLLNHSRARELWNFVTRATPDKPYKQFRNGTGGSDKSTNGATNRTSQPARSQPGSKRQEWSDLEREMRPRFFFNSAPAEYVEQKPPPAQTPNEGTTHLRQGPIRVHGPFNGNGPVPFIHGENNHLHLLKHPGHLTPLPINVFGHPPPNHLVSSLTFHNHHAHMHHFAPPPPYAIHIDAPPKLEPPMPPDVIPPPIPPVEVPPPIPPEVLGDQIPPAGPPMKGPPLLQDVPIIPPPDGAMINHPPIDSPVTNEGILPEYSMMPPPDAPVPQQPIDVQGMPPPGVVSPIPPPFPIQKVPVPVPVPSPPKVEHVPYPVPVPGPPSIQQVMVPVRVPSPPKIEEVPVPVPSPPKIRNVPVPFPVPVPSPPRLQRVPYPVPVPIKEPPEIHRVFLPVAVPQPSSVRHVPYPVYIRYPPEIKRVPFPVPAPPQPIPVPVPSPPRLMVHRIPFPVMYPQKVPFPVPVVINHHLMHQSADHTEESFINGQCLVNLCLNGGTCSAYMNSYRCHCPNGFQGAHCEEQNLCLPNPCRNFGVCSRVEHDYECTCSKGFIGRNCDKPDPCVPSPCENGATCSSDGNSYSCSCRVGWMGKNCQVESKCLPLNPCQNGGTCTEAQGAYKCECTPGWTGLSCEVGCDNCPTPDEHFLEEIKRNKLRNKMASVKKGTVTKSYKLW